MIFQDENVLRTISMCSEVKHLKSCFCDRKIKTLFQLCRELLETSICIVGPPTFRLRVDEKDARHRHARRLQHGSISGLTCFSATSMSSSNCISFCGYDFSSFVSISGPCPRQKIVPHPLHFHLKVSNIKIDRIKVAGRSHVYLTLDVAVLDCTK